MREVSEAPATADQERIAQLERQLGSLRNDVAWVALLGFAILPGLLALAGLGLDYDKRLIASIVLALSSVYVRRRLLDAREARRAAWQRQQEFNESVSKMKKSP